MSVEIPLRGKYRSAVHGKYKSPQNGRAAAARTSRPLTDREKALHAAQPKKAMVIGADGKRRMVVS